MERLVVRQFIYPALLTHPPSLNFSDQFAFRPTGSTPGAIIAMLQTVTNLLCSLLIHVIIISLDFNKAFDTVRHVTLLQKLAQLDHVPDTVYNWLVNYFTGHLHCTTYDGSTSSLRQISVSIVQSSAIGPASYVFNVADLHTVSAGNQLCKYADDTYIHHHPSQQPTHPRYCARSC